MVCLSPTKMMRTMLLRPTPTTPRSDWRTQRLESPWLSGLENFSRFEARLILLLTTVTLLLVPRRIRRARTLKCFIILHEQILKYWIVLKLLSFLNVSSTILQKPVCRKSYCTEWTFFIETVMVWQTRKQIFCFPFFIFWRYQSSISVWFV